MQQKTSRLSPVYPSMTKVATMLKQEWMELVLREQHARDSKTHDQIQAEKLALKAQMVALLMLV